MSALDPSISYKWLAIPGNLLFTSLAKGNQLDSRLTTLETHPGNGVTIEEIEAVVQGLITQTAPLIINPRGLYSATTAYTKPDVIVASDGNTYVCKADTAVIGIDPVVDTSAWTILIEHGQQGQAGAQGIQGVPGQNAVANINAKGTYVTTTTYSKNDVVVAANNNSYLCLTDGTVGIRPDTDTTGKWCLFVMQGPQGPPGKDAPSNAITTANLSPALQSSIANADKLVAGSAEGSWGEIDTGKTFRGKKVYRCDYTLYINAAANQVADLTLNATPNYVDTIVSVGGQWSIGYQTEVHQIPDAGDGTNFAYVMLYGNNNTLMFRSKANNARNGNLALIIVEFCKK